MYVCTMYVCMVRCTVWQHSKRIHISKSLKRLHIEIHRNVCTHSDTHTHCIIHDIKMVTQELQPKQVIKKIYERQRPDRRGLIFT